MPRRKKDFLLVNAKRHRVGRVADLEAGSVATDDQIVGELHNGWMVANTTLAHERGTNFPVKEQVVPEVYLDELARLAAERGVLDDPLIADDLADAFVQLRLLRLQNWRTLSALGRGEEPGPA